MPYYDRLSQASYESPSGRSFSFSYRAVTREISHRIGVFEFPGVNGTLHQDRGVSGQIYPWTIFIHGPKYDLVADEFSEAVSETGPGFLNHPRWGRIRVQILRVSQNEELTDGAGQAVFNIQFQETLEREFPEVVEALQHAVPQFANEFQDTAIINYAEQTSTVSLEDKNALTQSMSLATDLVARILGPIAALDDIVATEFTSLITDIQNNTGLYSDDPQKFATSMISAIRGIAGITGATGTKAIGFATLIGNIQRGVVIASIAERNALLIDELIGTSAIVAMSESINTALGESSSISQSATGDTSISVPQAGIGFQTRGETLAAAILIRDSFSAIIAELDTGQTIFAGETLSDAYMQSIESYGSSARVAYSTIKATLDLAFSLPVERALILQADSTLINLCYELYGNVDDSTLDYFILTNNLNGAEIKTIPRGRQVIYYA